MGWGSRSDKIRVEERRGEKRRWDEGVDVMR